MADWIRKKSKDEEPEDFVLFNEDAEEETAETDFQEETDSENDITRELDELQELQEDNSDDVDFNSMAERAVYGSDYTETDAEDNAEAESSAPQEVTVFADEAASPAPDAKAEKVKKVKKVKKEKKSKEINLKDFFKNHKTLVLGGGITAAAVVLIGVLVLVLSILLNPYRGYVQAEVQKGNVIPSITTTGTMSENARYSITSLVSGTVVESVPQIGDTVTEGEVLYKLDDTEAQLGVKRAQNELDKSKAVGTSTGSTTARIYATEGGTVQTLNISKGSKVSAGQVVATVARADGTVVSVSSSVSGTVSAVSTSKGRTVSAGSLMATVTDDQAEADKKANPYDQKSNQYDLEAAKKQLENYTIKAPVSGVIIEKNVNVGDNVGITNVSNPMMVIMDMNSMKFTFNVDEYGVWDIEVGQKAIVNTDALPNETFAGEVTRVGSEGKVNEEGKTMFEVDVTIDEPGDLKVGMKVNAKIILASATNVLTVPKQALMEADGKNALVLVKQTETSEGDDIDVSDNKDEELAFPWIEVPKGCKLITVKYGITDGTDVEIISGLEQGDIIIFDPERENKDLEATATPTPDEEIIEGIQGDSEEDAADVQSGEEKAKDKESAITKDQDETENISAEEARKKINEKVQGLDM